MKSQKGSRSGNSIITIFSDDKKGLIGQILMPFNTRNYEVMSINVSRTDIHDLVLITLEANIPGKDLFSFLGRLRKIVEVYRVESHSPAEICLNKVGFFRLSNEILGSAFWSLLQKHGAIVSSLGEENLMVRKTGSDKDLLDFYNQLEGPYLLGFCKSGLIVEEILMPFDFHKVP